MPQRLGNSTLQTTAVGLTHQLIYLQTHNFQSKWAILFAAFTTLNLELERDKDGMFLKAQGNKGMVTTAHDPFRGQRKQWGKGDFSRLFTPPHPSRKEAEPTQNTTQTEAKCGQEQEQF